MLSTRGITITKGILIITLDPTPIPGWSSTLTPTTHPHAHTPTHHPTTHDVSILIALSRTSANPHLSNQIIREPRGYPYRLRSRVPSWGRHACPRSTQWVR